MKVSVTFAASVALLITAGCGGGSDSAPQRAGDDPFPLAIGDHWEMKVTDHRWGSTTAQVNDVTSQTQIDGLPAYVVRSETGVTTPYRHTESEVWQWPDSSTPPDQRQPVLKLKLPLRVGDQWNVVDERTDAGYDSNDDGYNEILVHTASTTVSGTAKIVTPVGTFADAFVVRTVDDTNEADGVTGEFRGDWSSYTRTEWYVPGIGLVAYETDMAGWGIFHPVGESGVLASYHLAAR